MSSISSPNLYLLSPSVSVCREGRGGEAGKIGPTMLSLIRWAHERGGGGRGATSSRAQALLSLRLQPPPAAPLRHGLPEGSWAALGMRPISSGGGGAKRGARVFLLICFSDNRGAKNGKAEERCWSRWRQGRLLVRLPVTVQYKGSNIPLGLI